MPSDSIYFLIFAAGETSVTVDRVLVKRAGGEIALQVSRSVKSVDNAVQRIRRKLARQLTSGDISES